jgi:hypothetical protein
MNEIATKTEQIELVSPSQILDFATNLKDMIVKNKLFTNIRGKNYVNVEGWQIAGAFTGTFPIVESVDNLSDDKCYRYRAEVSLRDKDGNKVGYGVAICTNKEAGKTNFDEYAVASMAQTRAVGKAFRMKIGWLLKVAGYETTPAEEMDAVAAEVIEEDRKPASKVNFREVREKLTEIDNLDELNKYWKSLNLTDAQAEILKTDFATKKIKLTIEGK